MGLGPFEGPVANTHTDTQNKGSFGKMVNFHPEALALEIKRPAKKPTLSPAGAVSRAFLEVCVSV